MKRANIIRWALRHEDRTYKYALGDLTYARHLTDPATGKRASYTYDEATLLFWLLAFAPRIPK